MKSSIFYLVIFAILVIIGLNVDWQNWAYGFVAGISAAEIFNHFSKEKKTRRVK